MLLRKYLSGGLLAFRQFVWNAGCSRRKWFTIMPRLPRDPQDAPALGSAEPNRRGSAAKPFDGLERRRNPAAPADTGAGMVRSAAETNEIIVFHELGKALTSSLQLD